MENVREQAGRILFLVVFGFLCMHAEDASAGGWLSGRNVIGYKKAPALSPLRVIDAAQEEDGESIPLQEPQVTSSVPKLFWFDCGFDDTCASASLNYVDPGAATPVKTTFAGNIFVPKDFKSELAFPSGTLNASTYQVTNVKLAQIVYFSGGKIWKVNTITLAKAQVSSESSLSPNTLCEARGFNDWKDPANHTLAYRMSGPDQKCNTSDDISRAIKLGMTAATAPINLGQKSIFELLFDKSYIVNDNSTSPPRLKHCPATLTACSDVATFLSDADTGDFDSSHVLISVDGKLLSYNYTNKTAVTLYTPAASEMITSSRLDKNGSVFFATAATAAPYANRIRKTAKTGGAASVLTTFTTAYPVQFLDVMISPARLAYTYHNAAFSAAQLFSMAKGGGTPVSLSNIVVQGVLVGDAVVFEDTAGNVVKINLDGTGRLTKANARIHGASWGGSGDLFYEFDPASFRGLISTINNALKSYAIGDDFTLAATGTSLGTIPVNLSNFFSFDVGYDMIGYATKRDMHMSFGTDILFLRASTASSLKRITNTNGMKLTYPEPR